MAYSSHNIPVGFHFRVNIEDLGNNDIDIRFQEVSGLNITIGEETYEEGGENRFTHRLPGRVTYDKLVLKRGLIKGSMLINWFRDAVESFQFDPKNLTVTLLNSEHEPLEAWAFVQAYPIKWSISNFNAQQNELVIETIELNFQYLRRLGLN